MKSFSSIQELFEEIDSDKLSNINDRYPIRFIFLSSVQSLKEVVKAFDKHRISRVELTTFLPHGDGWLTVHEIIKALSSMDVNKDAVILPLSELVRFFDKDSFLSIFNRLSEIENVRNKKRRLYIPLVGIFERFNQEFYSFFHRKDEWAPIWQIYDETFAKNKVYIVDFKVDNLTHVDFIQSTKDWLSAWKKDDLSNLLCSSKNLSVLCKNTLPDQVFDVDEIHNIKELLAKVYRFEVPFEYVETDNPFWERLFKEALNLPSNDFSQLVKKICGVDNIASNDILRLWLGRQDTFHKWLLRNFVVSRNEWSKSYLCLTLANIDEIDDLALCSKLWLAIFESNNTLRKKSSEERRVLLKDFYEIKPQFQTTFIEDDLKARLEGIPDTNEKLSLLTDITGLERGILLNLFSRNEVTEEALRDTYQDLYYYLDNLIPDNLQRDHWLIEYFREYKMSKLKDEILPPLQSLLREKNNTQEEFYKWYYSIQSISDILLSEKVSRIFLIDAVGMEWLSYLCYLMETTCGLNVDKKYIARANLPSITECNRIPDSVYIQSFDKDIIHSDYKYPDTFIHQLSFLRDIVRKYIFISGNEKIAILSDHGTTALARLDNHLKSYDFAEASHEGRCMWLDKPEEVNDRDIILHEANGPAMPHKRYCLITLNYTSLYHRPRRETHGGGTPEEILVPVVIVSRKKISDSLSYIIDPKEIILSKRNPELLLQISPVPKEDPRLILDNKNIGKLKYDAAQDKWYIRLDKLKSGSYNMGIRIGDWHYNMKVEIKGGMQESDLL